MFMIIEPANNNNLAHFVRPCNAAFINGVNPILFLWSIFKLRQRVINIFNISDWPISYHFINYTENFKRNKQKNSNYQPVQQNAMVYFHHYHLC